MKPEALFDKNVEKFLAVRFTTYDEKKALVSKKPITNYFKLTFDIQLRVNSSIRLNVMSNYLLLALYVCCK